MGGPGFLEVDTPVVRHAGERTADTAALWQSWGNRIGIALRHAESPLQSRVIYAAVERYAEQVVPDATRVSQQVYDLGVNTASGATTVDGSDAESADELARRTTAAADQGSLLSRGINVYPDRPVDGQLVAN